MDGRLIKRADKVAFFKCTTVEGAVTTVAGTGITGATVAAATFATQIATSGTYEFEFDGTDWNQGGSPVTLATYGITTTGTETTGDKITVVYTKGGEIAYHRMQGFSDMSRSLNPKEYSRQYVDEEFEQTDVVGFSPSISYSFDQYLGNAVHDELVRLTDNEAIGSDAVKTIVIVDFTKPTTNPGEYQAVAREFSVIPDSEGGSMDAYTYSGTFKVKGNKIEGTATTTDDWLTLDFVQA